MQEGYKWDNVEAVLKKYSPMLYKIAYSYTGNREDSEDILQEVFIRFAKQSDFKDEEHQKAWLIRVTINHSINLVKSSHRKKTVSMEGIEPAAASNEIEIDETKTLIMKLPIKYRAVIYLFYYEGYEVEEIAEILGNKKSSVYTLLRRGREALKKLIEEGGNSIG